jgi:hypothetical protein
LDLARYNSGPTIDRSHKDIFEVDNLRTFLKSIIKNIPEMNQYVVDDITGLSATQDYLKYEVHSPLDLHVYDGHGHHTGISTTTGQIETGVEGSAYFEIGESKVILLPQDIPHTMELDAYRSGSFTLDVEKINDMSIIASTSFMGIPTSTTTKASLNWNPSDGIGTSTTLQVDFNGDDIVDTRLTAQEGEVVLLPTVDQTPPVTTASTSGAKGINEWYKSAVIVALSATDTESGVASTTYSLDGGNTWLNYISPITVSTEGLTSLRYYSTDKAGNSEETHVLSLKIDTLAPEAIVSVSTSTQDLLIEGKDTLGTTTVSKDTSGNYLITDQAGHTTKLFFTKTYSGKLLTYAKFTGIQYDARAKITLPASSFVYLWDNKSPATLVSQTIAVDGTYLIQAVYDKAKNKTTIVVLKKNLPIQTSSLTGLKLVKLTTTNGVVGYGW